MGMVKIAKKTTYKTSKGKVRKIKPLILKGHTLDKKTGIISKKKKRKKPKHKKYAEMISFKNSTQARISARKLRKEFREAKRKDKKIRIVRATQYASNRAKTITKKKNLNIDERKQFKEIGKIYDTTAKSMREKL